MAQGDEISQLRKRVAELEQRAGIPIKQELSKKAASSGEERSVALQLPKSARSDEIARHIAALADLNNVVVEWTAHDIRGTAAASSCCCCCCCCHESSAIGAGEIGAGG
jgi:streptolysin S family bacteriocin protoxin